MKNSNRSMRHGDLEKQLARESGLSRAEARDELAEAVRQVLGSLRKGKATDLPGVGQLAVKRLLRGARREPSTR